MKQKITRRQLQRLINEEVRKLQSEGWFSNIAAPAARYIPGGGAALDFMRSRAFDRIEKKLEELENRIIALESPIRMPQ